MIGIYCYYRNGQPVYVGASIDIDRRQRQHRTTGRFLNCDFKILEETTTTDLFDRERHYIITMDMCQVGENKVIHNNMDMPKVREANAKRMKENNPMKPGMTNGGSFKKGQKPILTPERNRKISEGKKGSKNPNFGNKDASLHLNKYLTCEVCGVTMNKGNFIRWGHGPECTSRLSI